MHPPQSSTTPAPVSRAGFLRRGALALGAGGIGAALAGGPAAADPSADDAEPARAADANPNYRRPRITRIGSVTGPGITTRFRMDAADLGASALTPDGRILAIFGDTFEQPAVGGSWWRSPVGLFADADRPLTAGIRWTSAVGGEVAEQLVDYAHDSAPVSTILPGDVLTVGDTMYVWVMVNHGFGNVAGTEIWTSEDSGETWERTAEMFPGDHLGGLSQQCTWALHPTDGHVYLLTTGFQRDKGAILQRVPQEQILDPAAYEVWGAAADGGKRSWGRGLEPADVLGGHVGEMCLRLVEDRWVLIWFNAGLYRVDVLVADSPTGLATPTFTETLLWGGIWGAGSRRPRCAALRSLHPARLDAR